MVVSNVCKQVFTDFLTAASVIYICTDNQCIHISSLIALLLVYTLRYFYQTHYPMALALFVIYVEMQVER